MHSRYIIPTDIILNFLNLFSSTKIVPINIIAIGTIDANKYLPWGWNVSQSELYREANKFINMMNGDMRIAMVSILSMRLHEIFNANPVMQMDIINNEKKDM